MSDSTETKICPLCAEIIKAAAKICPFCRTRQSRFGLLKYDLALGVFFLLAIGGLITAGLWCFNQIDSKGRDFDLHRDELQVLRTSLEPAAKAHNGNARDLHSVAGTNHPARGNFWLSGYVTNCGDYPWRVEKFEARFLSANNNLLDTQQPDPDESFVVPAHREQAFRIELYGLAFTNSAVSLRVRVQSALDPNASENN